MDSGSMANNDEWEYEYDQNTFEVFLVDLDLTTLHRTFKSTATDRGKRLIDLPDQKNAKRRRFSKLDQPPPSNDNLAAQQSPNLPARGTSEEINGEQHGLQFLDLHSGNPIVSYKGEVFSCTWTDMIGTNMFFSQPKETPMYDPEISTRDFDLIGTSRIKLTGNPAKVTPIQQTVTSATANAGTPYKPLNVSDNSGKSLGSIRRSNAKVNADIRKQADFLEQLMNIKKNRGEKDNVHVIMNSKISKSISMGKLKFNTQRRGDEIDKLNRRIVRGDGDALRRLEQIYSGRDDDSDEEPLLAKKPETTDMDPRHDASQGENADDVSALPDVPPGITSIADPFPESGTDFHSLDTNNEND